jgi:hypothetical protein
MPLSIHGTGQCSRPAILYAKIWLQPRRAAALLLSTASYREDQSSRAQVARRDCLQGGLVAPVQQKRTGADRSWRRLGTVRDMVRRPPRSSHAARARVCAATRYRPRIRWHHVAPECRRIVRLAPATQLPALAGQTVRKSMSCRSLAQISAEPAPTPMPRRYTFGQCRTHLGAIRRKPGG